MAKEKLFRETPFNGYNRDDVADYIAEMDKRNSQERQDDLEEIENLRASLEEKDAEIEKLNEVIRSLNFTLDEKNREMEAVTANAETEAPEPETEEPEVPAAEEPVEKLIPVASPEQEAKIADLTAKLSEAKAVIADQEQQIREYIEKVCLLEAADHNDAEIQKKLSEAEAALEEKDRKIEFLRQGWEQYKKNYGKYMEVSDSADSILADAQKEAAKILEDARDSANLIKNSASKEKESIIEDINGEVQLLIANAIKESGRILSNAEEKAKSIRTDAESSTAKAKETLSGLQTSLAELIRQLENPSASEAKDEEAGTDDLT